MQVCVFPNLLALCPPATVQGQEGQGAGCTVLNGLDQFLEPHALRDSPSLANSPEEVSSFSEMDHYLAPMSRHLEPPHVGSRQDTEDFKPFKPELPLPGKLKS